MSHELSAIQAALGAWGLEAGHVERFGRGLINDTWLIEAGERRYVLQRVSGIFPVEVNRDIDVITRHLEARGLVTCRLIPTTTGELWRDHEDGTWRLLTYVDGISHDRLATPDQAESAGQLLAAFHRAVDDLDHEFTSPRLGIHDTARHLRFLRDTLSDRAAHPRHAEIAQLAARIFSAADGLPEFPATADRIVHGDPKINNLLFDRQRDRAFSLVDLDTIARMPLPLELGDAMRSWCNPAGEDDQVSAFSATLFAQSINGYAEVAAGWITPEESASIVAATETILVELASRFCADALNENYFGWNPERFATRSEHNEERATSQLHVAESLAAQREDLEKIVSTAFK